MRSLEGKVAVVTGSAGGIGVPLVEVLTQEGCRVALVDKDEDAVRAQAAALKSYGHVVSVHVLDVRDNAGLEQLVPEIEAIHGGCDLLVCSAGVTVHGPFSRHTADDIDWLLDTNLRSLVQTCRVFLPLLRRSSGAHVVLLSSMTGLFGTPTESLYSASKHGVLGFGHALRTECAPLGIGVTTVLPGAVATLFVANGRARDPEGVAMLVPMIARHGLRPERLASKIVSAIKKNKREISVGVDARFVRLVQWVAPWFLHRVLAFVYRRYTPGGTLDGEMD